VPLPLPFNAPPEKVHNGYDVMVYILQVGERSQCLLTGLGLCCCVVDWWGRVAVEVMGVHPAGGPAACIAGNFLLAHFLRRWVVGMGV
jgi:hypothetical protein